MLIYYNHKTYIDNINITQKIPDLYKALGHKKVVDEDDRRMLQVIKNQEERRTFLKAALEKKKVLLILDDVWDGQHDHHEMMYWLY